jgi:hypothetical protein
MIRIDMRLNLAVHLPLRWIAALLYLMRWSRCNAFRWCEALGS